MEKRFDSQSAFKLLTTRKRQKEKISKKFPKKKRSTCYKILPNLVKLTLLHFLEKNDFPGNCVALFLIVNLCSIFSTCTKRADCILYCNVCETIDSHHTSQKGDRGRTKEISFPNCEIINLTIFCLAERAI